MASLGNPKAWVPYMNSKDCSQGFCSVYCPQWCYVIYPPPSPSPFEFPDEDSSPNFSPLVIAIIGILASAFLLVTYYTIISKYCGRRESSLSESREANDEFEDDHHHHHNPSIHEPWHVSTNGLDETLIKSITVCKYKKNDGLVDVTDCSVCLNEFQDDESIRSFYLNVAMLFIFHVLIHGSDLILTVLFAALPYSPSTLQVQVLQHFMCQLLLQKIHQRMKFL